MKFGGCLMPGARAGWLGGAVGFDSPGIAPPGAAGVPAGDQSRYRAGTVAVTVGWALPGRVGHDAPRLGASHDMPVIDRQSGRWYVKDIRASTQPMGTP
jgi:hypothetical protein